MQLRSSHTSGKIYLIDKEIANISSQGLTVTRLYNKGVMGFDDYLSRKSDLDQKISILRRKRRLYLADDEDEKMLSDLRELDEIIAGIRDGQTQFDEQLFSTIVKKVAPVSNEEIAFSLIGGLNLTERVRP